MKRGKKINFSHVWKWLSVTVLPNTEMLCAIARINYPSYKLTALSASKQHWLTVTYWPDSLQFVCELCSDGHIGRHSDLWNFWLHSSMFTAEMNDLTSGIWFRTSWHVKRRRGERLFLTEGVLHKWPSKWLQRCYFLSPFSFSFSWWTYQRHDVSEEKFSLWNNTLLVTQHCGNLCVLNLCRRGILKLKN